jgi:hypothetical protein
MLMQIGIHAFVLTRKGVDGGPAPTMTAVW